jgi:hypothetical protein
MLCCALLCCAVLCCAVLCCAVLLLCLIILDSKRLRHSRFTITITTIIIIITVRSLYSISHTGRWRIDLYKKKRSLANHFPIPYLASLALASLPLTVRSSLLHKQGFSFILTSFVDFCLPPLLYKDTFNWNSFLRPCISCIVYSSYSPACFSSHYYH